jgi:ribosomal protein S18 acetylase RimI-like enzyme
VVISDAESPRVRPAGAGDLAAVLALWREAEAVPGATDDPDALALLLRRDPGALLVAELEDRLVGCLIAAFDGWRGNMYRLAVHPTCRGRAVGARLVAAGEARLRSVGARRISALVVSDDSHAVDFWLRAGYEHDRRLGRFVKNLPAPPMESCR